MYVFKKSIIGGPCSRIKLVRYILIKSIFVYAGDLVYLGFTYVDSTVVVFNYVWMNTVLHVCVYGLDSFFSAISRECGKIFFCYKAFGYSGCH